jgi:hypothetical protein
VHDRPKQHAPSRQPGLLRPRYLLPILAVLASVALVVLVATIGRMTASTSTEANETALPGWWGWDPESTDLPPLLPEFPWHDNTGVWRAEDRDSLRLHDGDFTTTSDGQVIDLMNITGGMLIKHDNVTVKRSWVHGRIENVSKTPVRVIHCDMGDGKAGDYKSNGTKGVVHVYRSNLFGLTDGVQTRPATGLFIFQDNFVHDLRYATDPTVASGGGHNDGFKGDTDDVIARIKHNTFWSWTMNNMTEQETATRSSGPNWTENGGPLTSTGNMARDGKPENGLQNAAVMLADRPSLQAYIDSNLFRGHTYYHININGGSVEVTNNMFSLDENVAGRRIVAGGSEIKVWSGNTNYATGLRIDS